MFSDLVVIELASVLAGPAVGTFFAELGAHVVKIENLKTGGDVTRTWRLAGEDRAISAYYSAVNFGKENLMLDLTSEIDRMEVRDLISKADIVIANYKPGDAEKLGMDYESLKSLKEDLIYLSLKGFDQQPSRVAYDVVLQAETGFMYMNGTPDSGPVKMPVALIDLMAAHQLKEAALIALLKREKTGEGSFVETSLEKSALSSLANQATNWLMNAHNPQPLGSIHPNIAPYGEIFKLADGAEIVLAIGSNTQFRDLWGIAIPDQAIPEKFQTNSERVKNRKELEILLNKGLNSFTFEKVSIEMEAKKIPFGKIKSVKEVMESPTAKTMLLHQEIDETATVRLSTLAFEKFW